MKNQDIGTPRAAILAAMLLLAFGCTRRDQPAGKPRSGEASAPARCEMRQGPVRVIVEMVPGKARLSDQPKLKVRIEAAAGVEVRKPELDKTTGDFLVREFHAPLPRVENECTVLEQVYTLEPMRAGRLSIAPIRVAFTGPRRQNGERETVVETKALSVEIVSVVEPEDLSLADLRPPAAPVEIPGEQSPDARWLLAAPLAALVAAAGWLAWNRRKRPSEPPRPSPQEQARLELERLLDRELATIDVKLFYVELSAVVRRYIERTTGVRAPEQTTEEFLREIAVKATFPSGETQHLKQFLESADLVKFAAHLPSGDAVDESIRRARQFIGLESAEAPV